MEINGVARRTGTRFLGLTQVEIQAGEILTTGQFTVTLRNPLPGGGVSAPFVLTVYAPAAGDDLPDRVIGQKGFTSNAGAFTLLDAATLFAPGGAVVDPQTGRLFVADTSNARVLSWPSGAVQADGQNADLILGQQDFQSFTYYINQPKYSTVSPAGLALDSQGNLYVTDALYSRVLIFRAPFTNGMAADLVIGEAKPECATLCNPLALALDSQDNLYVADSGYHRVLFYQTPLCSSDATPDRVLGQPDFASHAPNGGTAIGAAGFNAPSGLAVDRADSLYVADSANHRILIFLDPAGTDAVADRVIGQGGSFTTGVANSGGLGAASLHYPYGLALDGAENLFVADTDNNRVLRFDAPLTTDLVADAVYGQSGSFTTNQPNTARTIAQPQGGPSQGSLRQPLAVGLAADGDLFAVDTGNNRVLTFRGVGAPRVNNKLYLPTLIN